MIHENSNLMATFGLPACAAVREVVLPNHKEIIESKDGDLHILICSDKTGDKANILCKHKNLSEYLELLNVMYKKADFFLCERSIRLNDYISCEKVNYGFFYKFKSRSYDKDALSCILTPVASHIDEVKRVFLEQKKTTDLSNIEHWLQTEAISFCIEDDNDILGIVVLSKYFEGLFINLIYVNEKYRHRGVGSELLKALSNYSFQEKIDCFYGMSPHKTRHFYKTLDIVSTEGWILWKKKI